MGRWRMLFWYMVGVLIGTALMGVGLYLADSTYQRSLFQVVIICGTLGMILVALDWFVPKLFDWAVRVWKRAF